MMPVTAGRVKRSETGGRGHGRTRASLAQTREYPAGRCAVVASPSRPRHALAPRWCRGRMRRGLTRAVFNAIHRNHLVYNACWENPRLDRIALRLGPTDTVVVITSAGCNALDYALDGPRHIHAVDLNPRQNALLELKQAGIRALDYDTFFAVFGRGRLAGWAPIYRDLLRPQLSPWARQYWDARGAYFQDSSGSSFYFRGTTGAVARAMNFYLDRIARARGGIEALLEAPTLEAQRGIYDRLLGSRLWTPLLKWIAGHDLTLSLLAVPPPQRRHLEATHRRGIADFIQDRIEAVFTRVPLADNYFWRVYLTGAYQARLLPGDA